MTSPQPPGGSIALRTRLRSFLARFPLTYLGNPTVVLGTKLKAWPTFFRAVAPLREDHKKHRVRRTTELVIEGPPRCGNHFATYAFVHAQRRPIEVAHHFHAPAQVLLAVRWRIPVLVLTRKPIDQVLSLMVFFPRVRPEVALRAYLMFFEPLLPVLDHVVVADFEEVTRDMGGVIARINRRFGTSFRGFEHSPENLDAVAQMVHREHLEFMGGRPERDPSPTSDKEARKGILLGLLEAPPYRRLRDAADDLHAHLLSHTGAPRSERGGSRTDQRAV